MNNSKEKGKRQWLDDAIGIDAYLVSIRPEVREIADRLFADIEKKLVIRNRARSKEALKVILLNAWVGFLVNAPIRYSRRKETYSLPRRYGLLHFKYARVLPIVDTLGEMGLLYGQAGYQNREDNIRKQSRFWATERLIEDFLRAVEENPLEIIEKAQPKEIIQLREKGKENRYNFLDYQENDNTIGMRKRLYAYNEFVGDHHITIKYPFEQLDEYIAADIWDRVARGKVRIADDSKIVDQDKSEAGVEARTSSNSIDYPYNVQIPACRGASICPSSLEYTTTSNSIYNYPTIPTSIISILTPPLTGTLRNTLVPSGVDIGFLPDRFVPMKTEKYLHLQLEYEYLHRVFNRGNFGMGGRYYGAAHIEMKKQLRPFIEIDGRKTVELDYSAYHIRMLYHMNKKNYLDDPYDILCESPEERKIYKTLLLVAINSEHEREAVNATRKELVRRGIVSSISRARLYELLKRFYKAHSPITGFVNSDIGIHLQRRDSEIVDEVLGRLMKKGVLALPVHDSFIVADRHKPLLAEAMNDTYEAEFGFPPVIDEK